jgi:hypothetical protein
MCHQLRGERTGCAGSSTTSGERAGRARSPSQVPALGRSLAALTLSVLQFSACGASLGQEVRRDIGRATIRDIELHVPRILASHGYTVSRQRQTGIRIQYETSWLHRVPFEDETEKGVEEVRTRLTVEARKGAADFYDVQIRAENTVRGVSLDGAWTPLATNTFQEHLRALADDIVLHINSGVRRR